MLKLSLLIKGKVQGVGYRYSIYSGIQSQSLNVTGYVRNLPDGSVEVIAEGDIESLKKVHQIASQGSSHSFVREINEEINPVDSREFDKFEISK